MQFFEPSIIWRVITAPNSAFTQIRERHLASAIVIFLISSAMNMLLILPFVIISTDEAYHDMFKRGYFDYWVVTSYLSGFIDKTYDYDTLFSTGHAVAVGIIFTVLFYFIGRRLGGNKDWKRVFSVLFYAHVPIILMNVALTASIFLVWGAVVSTVETLDSSHIMGFDSNEAFPPLNVEILAYIGLLAAVLIGFVAWIIVIVIKAIKTVNGFGTAKAFGLVVLVPIIIYAMNILGSIVYLGIWELSNAV